MYVEHMPATSLQNGRIYMTEYLLEEWMEERVLVKIAGVADTVLGELVDANDRGVVVKASYDISKDEKKETLVFIPMLKVNTMIGQVPKFL
jgi:hypothetical protein